MIYRNYGIFRKYWVYSRLCRYLISRVREIELKKIKPEYLN
jgi:hypothetical protein